MQKLAMEVKKRDPNLNAYPHGPYIWNNGDMLKYQFGKQEEFETSTFGEEFR